MGEPIQEGSGQSLGAEGIGPLLERWVGGDHVGVVFTGPAGELEVPLGSCGGDEI